ncbi:hypothetical protein ACHWQZ_G012892 [Mnemiopsis leidyi]
MNYSPVHNDLFTSFNKIGSEIDDIFNNLDIFNQSSERYLKGGSSVDFLGSKDCEPQDKPKQKLNFSETVENELSSQPHSSVVYPDFLAKNESSAFNLARCGSSTPVPAPSLPYTTHPAPSLPYVPHHPLPSQNGHNSSRSSSQTNLAAARSWEGVSREKELCGKHQEQIKELRSRILNLTDRIQITAEERNKVFYKLEAAVREVNTQEVKKEALSQKVQDLNQKMLENDYEINQLKSQISLLDGQIDATQISQVKLLEKLEETRCQLGQCQEEKEQEGRAAKRSEDECRNLVQKYQLLEKIHEHCSSVQNQESAERGSLAGKVGELNKVISAMQGERAALIHNLEKVHKLVDKLERKATDKIQVLCRELQDLQSTNVSLKSSLQEKDALLSVNRATIRDLESKLIECERETADVKRFVQDHQRNQQESILTKNKKIKILSLKVKQLQTRMQTQISQISILTETNEKLEEKMKEEKIKTKDLELAIAEKDKQIADLGSSLEDKLAQLKEGGERVRVQGELEASIVELVQQREAIQSSLALLEETNSSRLKEVETLQHSLASVELEKEASLHEMHCLLNSKERKICKLKEGVNQLVSSRQETLAELQELRMVVAGLQGEVERVRMEGDERERHLTADLKEKCVQIEQYKELLGEERARVPDLETEYELVSAAVRVTELEAENKHLQAALDRAREKHSRLKLEFGRKVREQNEVIDNCVERAAVEKQIAELRAHYESRISQLESSLG